MRVYKPIEGKFTFASGIGKFLLALVISISCLPFSLQAYHARIDSLLTVVNSHTAQDTALVSLLDKTAFLLRFNDPDKAMLLACEQLLLSQKLSYNYGTVYALNHIGTIHKIRGTYDKAMQYYIRASQVSSQTDTSVLKGVALAYNNIALLFKEREQYKSAEHFFGKALNIDTKYQHKKGIAREYCNLGNMYMEQNKMHTAIEYIKKGYQLHKEINHKVGLIESLNDLAFASYKMGRYADAEKFLIETKEINDGLCVSSDGFTLYTWSLLLQAREENDKALNYALQAYGNALDNKNTKLLERTSLNLASLYSKTGDHKAAAEIYPLYIKYLSEANSQKQNLMLADIQEKYDSDSKQKEIEELSASNEKFGYYNKRLLVFRNWLFLATLVMTFLLVSFYHQYRSKLKVNKELMMKFAEVRRMNGELNRKNEEIGEKNNKILLTNTALKQQEKQLSEAQQIARLGSWEKDMATGEVTWSDQLFDMLGLNRNDGPVSLIRCAHMVYPDDRQTLLKSLKGLFRNNISFDIEFRINGSFDAVRSISFKGQPVFENNHCVKFNGTLQEITEQKETEKKLVWAKEQAESASRTKGLFLANMSHEIRTPLNGILGFTDLMLEKCDDVQYREYLQHIKNSGDTLVILLNDILDFNKIEHGKLNIEKVNYRFKQEVEIWSAPYRLQAREKGIDFLLNIDPSIPEYIESDPYRTRQILVNYISNALKFTDKGMVSVTIKAEEVKNEQILLHFNIADSGIGVRAEKQLLIFDLFTQADDSTTRKYGGTGLGLAINKQLSIMMGGDAGVSSPGSLCTVDAPGSDFWFSIRVTKGKEEPVVPGKTFTKKSFAQPPRILVAEDNPVNQLLMKKVLGNMNCNVTMVDNGQSVIDLLHQETFDALLLDIQMPVMDGYQATELIRKSPQYKELPIIGVSANVFKEDIERSMAIGMNAHIGKPFKTEELFEILSKLIRNSVYL